MTRRCASYREFWPVYLHEHAKPATRTIHVMGTGLAFAVAVAAVAAQQWWLLALTLVVGYAPAWFAHWFIEQNRPATFTHPLWSLVSDFRMFFLWCVGRLDPELRRQGLDVG